MRAVTIRPAVPGDAGTVLALIRALAAYEREPDAVEATEAALRAQMASARPPFECLLAERAGRAVGFALFFQNYSTWRGLPGLWLEDLFVLPEERGRGVGGGLLRAVGRTAVERGCARLEFAVLDWNEPALGFYRALGARAMTDWTVHRFEGEALARLGARGPA
jgi:GNAT superfamily N-acetyltransferase